MPKNQIHFFREIGYYHVPFSHCPIDATEEMACTCKQEENFGELDDSLRAFD